MIADNGARANAPAGACEKARAHLEDSGAPHLADARVTGRVPAGQHSNADHSAHADVAEVLAIIGHIVAVVGSLRKASPHTHGSGHARDYMPLGGGQQAFAINS